MPPKSAGPVQLMKGPFPTHSRAKPEPPCALLPTSYESVLPTRILGALLQSNFQSLAAQDREADRPRRDQSEQIVSRHPPGYLAPTRDMPTTNYRARGSWVPTQQVRVLTDLHLYLRTLGFDQLSQFAAIGDTRHRPVRKTQTEVAPQVAPSQNRPKGGTEFPNWARGNNPCQRRSDWPTRSAPHFQNDSTSRAKTGGAGILRHVRPRIPGILGPKPQKLFPFAATGKRKST